MRRPFAPARFRLLLVPVARQHLAILMAALLAAMIVGLSPALTPHARAAVGTLYAVTGAGGDTGGGGSGCSSGGSLSSLYTLDPSDASVLTGPTAITIAAVQVRHVTGIAVHPSTGVLYGVMNGQLADCADAYIGTLITIDKSTGVATAVGQLGTCTSPDFECHQITDIAFDPFGTLYAWDVHSSSYGLDTIDLGTGAATHVDQAQSLYGMGLAIDSGAHMYAAGTWSSYLWQVSHVTGFPFAYVTLGAGTTQQISNVLAFDGNDVLYAGKRISTGFTLYTLDLDGTLTSVGSNLVTKIGAIAFDFGVVTPPDSADLSLDKTVDDPAPAVGDTITFTLTVTNDGPETATGVEVTDTWGTLNYTFLSSSGDGSYDDTTGVWTIGSISSGSSASIDIDVTVNRSLLQSYRNTARITADDTYDPDSEVDDPIDGTASHPGDIYASVTPNVYDPDEDFGVTLTVNGPTHAGGKTKRFVATITNVGTVTMNVDTSVLNATVQGVPVPCKVFSKSLAPGAYVRTSCTYSPANIGFGVGDTVTYQAVIDVALDGNATNDTATFLATAT